MRICVIGTGCVGLVVGSCLADGGHDVICVDKDKTRIDVLQSGRAPIHEPGLADMITRNLASNRLQFTTALPDAVAASAIIFLAVGTPEGDGGVTDLSQIMTAARDIAACVDGYKVIAIRSTVPIGTAKALTHTIRQFAPADASFDIVSNPEFLSAGSAIDNFRNPQRLVIGTSSPRALAMIQEVYRPLDLLDRPMVITTNETAETIKYTANTMLALKISFMNETANLCEAVGADVRDVALALGLDRRLGAGFLQPGPGFGGSCLPKDVASLSQQALEHGCRFQLAETIIEVNSRQRRVVVDKTRKALGTLADKTITLLGLSFKPDTNDVRQSPAMHIAKALLSEGASINAYDPAANVEARKVIPEMHYFDDPYSACDGSDMVMVLTEWRQLRDLDLAEVKRRVRCPNMYDARNIFSRQRMQELGFSYLGTGC